MKDDKFKVGDVVYVNQNAFDEQLCKMVDPVTEYTISEVKDVDSPGTTGQWVKVEGGVRLQFHDTGEVQTHTDWIDKAWCIKV